MEHLYFDALRIIFRFGSKPVGFILNRKKEATHIEIKKHNRLMSVLTTH